MDELARLLAEAPGARVGDKKRITEANFEDVFDYWNEVFGESVRNGYKSSRYFVADIQPGRTQLKADEGKVFFQVGPEEMKIKKYWHKTTSGFGACTKSVTMLMPYEASSPKPTGSRMK